MKIPNFKDIESARYKGSDKISYTFKIKEKGDYKTRTKKGQRTLWSYVYPKTTLVVARGGMSDIPYFFVPKFPDRCKTFADELKYTRSYESLPGASANLIRSIHNKIIEFFDKNPRHKYCVVEYNYIS